MADVLAKVRTGFLERVSNAVLKQLLDDLLEDGVLNEGEIESIEEENSRRADRARCLIDSVRRKGDTASTKMIARLQTRDQALYTDLIVEPLYNNQ